MEVGIRELRNRTGEVIDAVEAGERVVLTRHGRPIADIVPHTVRQRWMSGEEFARRIKGRQADPALARELDELLPGTLADL